MSKKTRKAITGGANIEAPLSSSVADFFEAPVAELTVGSTDVPIVEAVTGPVVEAPAELPVPQFEPVDEPMPPIVWHKTHWYEELWHNVRYIWRRCVPQLVWYGQEVDVRLVFTSYKHDTRRDGPGYRKLHKGDTITNAIELMRHNGIDFGVGTGKHGHDWFFDYSLKGPLRVKFIGPAKLPVKRQE